MSTINTVPLPSPAPSPSNALTTRPSSSPDDTQALLSSSMPPPQSTPPRSGQPVSMSQVVPEEPPAQISGSPEKRRQEDEVGNLRHRSDDWMYRGPLGGVGMPPSGYGPYQPPPPPSWDRDRERRRYSDWYPDYRGPERYLEYDPPGHSRSIRREGSRRERMSRNLGPDPRRRSYEDERYAGATPLPPGMRRREWSDRRYDSDEDDFDDERDYTVRDRKYDMRSTQGGGRGPPTEYRRTSLDEPMRLPFTTWMGRKAKGHFVATLGEFVGTTMFLFLAFAGTQVANSGSKTENSTTTGQEVGFSPQVLLYIALSFGFSLMVNVWVFFRISGGMFNPAVTLAMALTKAISPFRATLLVTAQIAGSILASVLVTALFPTQFNVRTTLSKETSTVRGVFIEAVLTFELIFTIFMLAKEKHKATFMAPVGIGLALFIAELVGVLYTGGSLNPARSFGPCVVTRIFDKEHWIYWVGPGAGSIIAVIFYRFIRILQYEIANPGQDEDSERAAADAAAVAQDPRNAKEETPV